MEIVETVGLSNSDRGVLDTPQAANRGELLEHPARTRARHKARAKVSNYCDLLPGVSGNSIEARRFRDLVNCFVVDLGGLDLISEIKLGLVRQLAAITVKAEAIEAQMVMGHQVDINALCTLASTVMRLSVRLGLERVAKPVPTIGDALKADMIRQQRENAERAERQRLAFEQRRG